MTPRTAGCCSCSGNACGLECQGKAGTTTHCGFLHFATTGGRRYYRRREISGTASACDVPRPDCEQPTCGGEITLDFSGEIPGYVGTFTAHGTLRRAGGLNYTAICTATHFPGGGGAPESISARLQVIIGGEHNFGYGTTAALAAASVGEVKLQLNYVAWTTVTTGCIDTGEPGSSLTGEVWDQVQHYDGTTCELSATVHSFRGTTTGKCEMPTSGDPIDCEPIDCYGPATEVTPTSRRWGDSSCTNTAGDRSTEINQDVLEELSEEDTLGAAIDRVAGGLTWAGGACDAQLAFATTPDEGGEFAFRKVQVRAVCGTVDAPLVVGHVYTVRIGMWRRAVASGGAWVYIGATVVSFTAGATIERTPWIDVPNEEAMETRAGGCRVIDSSV